jgi:predicted enzyme related to lactoylglutathione lyase
MMSEAERKHKEDAAVTTQASTDAKIQGIVQIHLPVQNLAAAVPYYRDKLGLPLMFETNGMAFFNVGGIRLMIGEIRTPDQKPGSSVVYFTVADVRKASAELEHKGVAFVGPVETVNRTATHDLLLRIFKDPDGNHLALMGETPRT